MRIGDLVQLQTLRDALVANEDTMKNFKYNVDFNGKSSASHLEQRSIVDYSAVGARAHPRSSVSIHDAKSTGSQLRLVFLPIPEELVRHLHPGESMLTGRDGALHFRVT